MTFINFPSPGSPLPTLHTTPTQIAEGWTFMQHAARTYPTLFLHKCACCHGAGCVICPHCDGRKLLSGGEGNDLFRLPQRGPDGRWDSWSAFRHSSVQDWFKLIRVRAGMTALFAQKCWECKTVNTFQINCCGVGKDCPGCLRGQIVVSSWGGLHQWDGIC